MVPAGFRRAGDGEVPLDRLHTRATSTLVICVRAPADRARSAADLKPPKAVVDQRSPTVPHVQRPDRDRPGLTEWLAEHVLPVKVWRHT
jgi:hypothetical protein